MTAGRPPVTDENVVLSGYVLDMTEFLQDCFEKLEEGHEDLILSDPFYTPRGGPFSDEKVDRLIAALDEEYGKEIDNYRAHHLQRSGANAKPDWHRMSKRARRAVAEGAARIIEEWADWDEAQKAPLPPPPPEYTG